MNMHLLHHTYITSNTNVSNSGRQNKQLESTSQKALIAQLCHNCTIDCTMPWPWSILRLFSPLCVSAMPNSTSHTDYQQQSSLLSQEQSSLQVWSHKSNWDGKYLPCAKVIGKDFSWMLMLEKGCQSWKIIGLIAIDLKLCILSPMSWEMLQGILIWHCQKPARPTSASPQPAWAQTPTSPATPAGPKNKGVTCRQ